MSAKEFMERTAHYSCFPPLACNIVRNDKVFIAIITDCFGGILAKTEGESKAEVEDMVWLEFTRAYSDALGDRKPCYQGSLRIIEAHITEHNLRPEVIWWKDGDDYYALIMFDGEFVASASGVSHQAAHIATYAAAAFNIARKLNPDLTIDEFKTVTDELAREIAEEIRDITLRT